MNKSRLKMLEKRFKRLLDALLVKLLKKSMKPLPAVREVQKVLVFRLDQRIGNGILLIPLLRAIRRSQPQAELHFLIHHPVAVLLGESRPPVAERIWPYNQPVLMRRPWRYLALLHQLRKERFDIALTSTNPDSFSLSQAIFGRLCRPRWLIGFDARSGAHYYDHAVQSSVHKHYSEAMVDLWRAIDPDAAYTPGGLSLPFAHANPESKKVLIWLGATGDKVLPGSLFASLYENILKTADVSITFACGPADKAHLQTFPEWIREKTQIWQGKLSETAAFFSEFRLFISGDTGPMHLAVALGIPSLTLFTNSNIEQYGYNDGRHHFAFRWDDAPPTQRNINDALRVLLNGNTKTITGD